MNRLLALLTIILLASCSVFPPIPARKSNVDALAVARQQRRPTPTAERHRVNSPAQVCGSGGLNVREGAGTSFAVLETLADGSTVDRLGVNRQAADGGTWEHVRYGAVHGWVNAAYLCEVMK